MNFFFKLSSKDYLSELTIPNFTNSGKKLNQFNLYSLNIIEDKNINYWNFNKLDNQDEFFFKINRLDKTNDTFFFIGSESICRSLFNKKNTELKMIKNFMNSQPPFRANTKIIKKDYGFSSYQSDYPFPMVMKKGSIVSPIQTLLNTYGKINKIFFVNMYYKPIREKFRYYLISYNLKKIIFTDFIYTNSVNEINIQSKYLNKDTFFVTKDYLGIPVYFSDQDGHLSLEHTHPPHEYIFGKNKYNKINEFKKEFDEIITKENL